MREDCRKSSTEPLSSEDRLVQLVTELGLKETEAMRDLRSRIEASDIKASLGTYQDLAGVEIDKYSEIPQRENAQIGLIVMSAVICRKLGAEEGYIDALDAAINYAEGIGSEDIAKELRDLISKTR